MSVSFADDKCRACVIAWWPVATAGGAVAMIGILNDDPVGEVDGGSTSLILPPLAPDHLAAIETLKVCVGYRARGKVIEHFPASLRVLRDCEPVYETLPGWSESLDDVRRFEDLPRTAQDYVRFIEQALGGVPAHLIGVGADRDATIERANPFDVPRRCP